MKAALVSWFITLIVFVLTKFLGELWVNWSSYNKFRASFDDYPTWIYILLFICLGSVISSVVLTFMFLFSL